MPLLSAHDLAAAAGLALALAFIQHWQPALPAVVPTHWDAAGRVDAWTKAAKRRRAAAARRARPG